MVRSLCGVMVALVAGCGTPQVFLCDSNTECVAGGVDGTCQPQTGFCSFPDEECVSGERYGSLAGGGLADQCVGASEVATSGPPQGTTTALPAPTASSPTTMEPGGTVMSVNEDSSGHSPDGNSSSGGVSGGATDTEKTMAEVCDGDDNDGDGLTDEVSDSNKECGGCSLRQFERTAIWVCNQELVVWTAAAEVCAKFGASLAVIEDSALQIELADLTEPERYWIGLTDADVEASWSWSDGTPAKFTNWRPTQPDNGEMIGMDQDCARLVHLEDVGSAYPGGWDDVQCTQASRYLCTAAHDPD